MTRGGPPFPLGVPGREASYAMLSSPAALGLDIAGIRTRLVTRCASVAAVARRRYGAFVTDGTASDWTIHIADRRARLGALSDVVVRRRSASRRFDVARHDFTATIDLDAHRAHAALAEADDIALDAFVRVAWSFALVEARGLLLHAASLARDGIAHVFCGPSGAGKTTIARLSGDRELLSDEISSVRLDADGAWCHGTPFFGELATAGGNVRRPLAAIHFLDRAERHERVPLTPRRALERLLPNVLFFARDVPLTARVVGIAADLVERVPCFALGFRPDPGFWSVIDD